MFVNPVIVMVPLLVVKVNWACNAAGGVNRNSGSSHVAQAVLKRVVSGLEQGVLAKLRRPLLNTPPHPRWRELAEELAAAKDASHRT